MARHRPRDDEDLKNNARTCTTRSMKRCVTLGIPPTPRPADPQWGLPAPQRRIAARSVDGFVWFGRPWLFNQADPFVTSRAVDMAAAPRLDGHRPAIVGVTLGAA